jgi:hypothetical protein
MAIYGIGAYYEEDVSAQFMANNIIGTGYEERDAPEIHEMIRRLKVGDIIYIKSYHPGAEIIRIKAIGIIYDSNVIDFAGSNGLVRIGRNVQWLSREQFEIVPPIGKNNVRHNTLYEEWHPVIWREIMAHI